MRELTDHIVNTANDLLSIHVTDDPGPGGANHRYEITGIDTEYNPSAKDKHGNVYAVCRQVVLFQHGPIHEAGVNGVTHEALIAILCDRLRGFQQGQYACKANACALTHLEEAQHWLQQRTIERIRRGVEGTNTI